MAAASVPPAPRPLLQGRYTRLSKLGDHAGEVFLARRESDARSVVIRAWRAETQPVADAFLATARAAMRVRHPALATIEASGEDAGRICFIVSEHVTGRPLDAWADRVGVPSFSNVIDVARRLCAALQAAAQAGLGHDALNPRNVIVSQDAEGPARRLEIKLLDLGVPGFVRPQLPSARAAQFMAPEQLAAVLSAGDRTRGGANELMNVYSLGCLLYYLCSGGAPFQGSSVDELRDAHANGKLVPAARINPLVPAALDAVISRALAIAPRERFPSIAELASALAHLDSSSASGVRPMVASTSAPPPSAASSDITGMTFEETPTLTVSRPTRARSETPIIDVSEFAELLSVGADDSTAPRAPSLPARTKPPAGQRRPWAWPLLLGTLGLWVFAALRPSSLEPRPATAPTASVVREAPLPAAPRPSTPPTTPSEPTPSAPPIIENTAPETASESARVKSRERARTPTASPTEPAAVLTVTPMPAPTQPAVDAGTRPPAVTVADVTPDPTTRALPPTAAASTPEPSAPSRPLAAIARITDLEVRGPLPSAVARRAIERVREQLAACYARAAQNAGRNGFGALRVELELDESARARHVRVLGGTLPGLDRCVSEVATHVVSERAPDTGTVKTSWKVVFEP